ncbi:MAG: permease [Bacteroidales bacterium]|nr:permease [Bacteroidales bacterium]
MKGWFIPVILLTLWIITYWKLQPVVDYTINNIFGLVSGKHLTETLRFFIFEVPKVILLLVLIIFIVGIIRTYFTPEKTRKVLEGKSLFTGNLLASLLGIVTPFCSCSAIPLFLGFVEAGVPLGVTFSFLIAAPMINEVALVLLIGLFGWKVAVIYVGTGLVIAIFSGWLIGKLHLEKYVAEWVYSVKASHENEAETKLLFYDRFRAGYEAVSEILGKIWIYIIIGIAVGAGAHGYVPQDFLGSLLGKENWYGVPLAIIMGIPMYSNAAGIIPIVSVLLEKGVSLGTALAFMMSVVGLSLPEIIILKKVLKWQLITAFVGIVAIGIVFVGFIFNYVM